MLLLCLLLEAQSSVIKQLSDMSYYTAGRGNVSRAEMTALLLPFFPLQ